MVPAGSPGAFRIGEASMTAEPETSPNGRGCSKILEASSRFRSLSSVPKIVTYSPSRGVFFGQPLNDVSLLLHPLEVFSSHMIRIAFTSKSDGAAARVTNPSTAGCS
jgi:hypothetical protein